jgi:hypothetical protein
LGVHAWAAVTARIPAGDAARAGEKKGKVEEGADRWGRAVRHRAGRTVTGKAADRWGGRVSEGGGTARAGLSS